MNVYDFINWFFMYSFLGYLLECIVLSAEYKRPVVDRGFGHGPFCVIYGFGALGACMSGTGPTAFGLFDCPEAAEEAWAVLAENCRDTFLCQTV